MSHQLVNDCLCTAISIPASSSMLLLTLAIALCVACSFTDASSDPGCTITSDLKYQKLSSYGEGFVKNVTKWFGPKFSGGDLGMDYSIQVPFTYKETNLSVWCQNIWYCFDRGTLHLCKYECIRRVVERRCEARGLLYWAIVR
ncbi:hypothetical protein OSTOST_06539 [Ostertagia ostertagi]